MHANNIVEAFERGAHLITALLVAALLPVLPAAAQPRLSLSEAITRARAHNPDVESAAAAERAATERLTQARGGYFPKVDVAESWQRGNHPVFVFSSLLAQQQVTAAVLAGDAITHPTAIDNFRGAFSVEQSLFDRATAASVRAASVGRDIAATNRQLVAQSLTMAVTDVFGRVLIAAATGRSAAAAVETARTDRELASNRRSAGRATDADVLQLEVNVARALEQQVEARSDERIARAQLNQLMGEPLSAMFSLDLTAPSVAFDIANPTGLEDDAVKHRPELALASEQEQLAAAAVDAARAAFLPQVAAQGVWELNGGAWQSRSSSWVVGVVGRVNVFHGFADRARLAEARAQARVRAIDKNKADILARLDVRAAIARLEAAQASEAVGRAAASQARESQRIIRDRYESGLVDAAMLLRAADAVQQADTREIAARVHVLTATATLQRAIGRP